LIHENATEATDEHRWTQIRGVRESERIRPTDEALGASQFLDDSGLLPLRHVLVEERVGERRLLVRW
jgi:hypothetical protein